RAYRGTPARGHPAGPSRSRAAPRRGPPPAAPPRPAGRRGGSRGTGGRPAPAGRPTAPRRAGARAAATRTGARRTRAGRPDDASRLEDGGGGRGTARERSRLADVRGLQALGALHDLELHGVTLGEGPEAVHHDGAVMHEDVLAAFLRDEAVALRVVEPLHGTRRHRRTSAEDPGLSARASTGARRR